MSKIAIVEVEYQLVVRHEVILPDETDLDDLDEVQDYVDDYVKAVSFNDGDIMDEEMSYDPEIISVEETGD